MSRRLRLVAVLLAVVLLVWGADYAIVYHWVGVTHLDVEFVVTDAETAAPIPGARVEVRSWDEEGRSERPQLTLVADAAGTARSESRCLCFGTESGLGFTDTYGVEPPFWQFRVTAPGYGTTEWERVGSPRNADRAERIGPGRAKLVVPIPRHKQPG